MLPGWPFTTEALTPPAAGGMDSSQFTYKVFFLNEDCIYLRCTTFNAPVETAIKVTPPSWGRPILKDRLTQGQKVLPSCLKSSEQLHRVTWDPLLPGDPLRSPLWPHRSSILPLTQSGLLYTAPPAPVLWTPRALLNEPLALTSSSPSQDVSPRGCTWGRRISNPQLIKVTSALLR